MAQSLISADQFYSELRRHGLRPTAVEREKFVYWETLDGKISAPVQKYSSFIPLAILIEQLLQFGIMYVDPGPVN